MWKRLKLRELRKLEIRHFILPAKVDMLRLFANCSRPEPNLETRIRSVEGSCYLPLTLVMFRKVTRPCMLLRGMDIFESWTRSKEPVIGNCVQEKVDWQLSMSQPSLVRLTSCPKCWHRFPLESNRSEVSMIRTVTWVHLLSSTFLKSIFHPDL